MTFLIIIAALIVAIAPALGCAILSVTLSPGWGPQAKDRAGKYAVAVFVAVYGVSAWGLIEWWM